MSKNNSDRIVNLSLKNKDVLTIIDILDMCNESHLARIIQNQQEDNTLNKIKKDINNWIGQPRDSKGHFIKGKIATFSYRSGQFPFNNRFRQVKILEDTKNYIFGIENESNSLKKFLKSKIKGKISYSDI